MNILSDIKITVGLITYNRPEFLKEAVRSVLQQSFENFELIISNDYPEVAITYESLGIMNDSRVKIVNQDPNLGEIRNMNFLVNVAKGDWFVWLADDDLLHPEFLTIANKFILEGKESKIVGFFSNYSSAINPSGVFPRPVKYNNCKYYDAPRFIIDYTARKNPLIGCYGVMHTDTLRKIGGIPHLGNSFGPYSDTLIPILLVEHGSLCWLDEFLIFLRTHPGSLSVKSTEFSAFTSAEVDFLENLMRIFSGKSANIKLDKVISNMIKWFSDNEWAVLYREPLLSKYEVVKRFINYQRNINFPRLSFRYRVNHFFYITFFLMKQVVIRVYMVFRIHKLRITLRKIIPADTKYGIS